MSIATFIADKCNDTAVYWGNPVNDGKGGFTYDDPVEIDCRWEDMDQIVSDDKGNTFTSRAQVFLTQDVDINGRLYHGTLDDLYDLDSTLESSDANLDPADVEGAYYIKRRQKIPTLNDPENFFYKAFLTPSLSFGGF